MSAVVGREHGGRAFRVRLANLHDGPHHVVRWRQVLPRLQLGRYLHQVQPRGIGRHLNGSVLEGKFAIVEGGEWPRPDPPAWVLSVVAIGELDLYGHRPPRGPGAPVERHRETFVVGADHLFQLAGLQVVAAEQLAVIAAPQQDFVAVDAQIAVTRTTPARSGVAHLQFDLARRLAVRADFLDHLAVEDVEDAVRVHIEGADPAMYGHWPVVDAAVVSPAILAVEADTNNAGNRVGVRHEVKGLGILADSEVRVDPLPFPLW